MSTERMEEEEFNASEGSYRVARFVYARVLGFCYFVAFGSLLLQITGLYGKNGILPIGEYLDAVGDVHGYLGLWSAPSVFWISQHDVFLQAVCVLGMLAGLAVIVGRYPWLASWVAWLLYLSVVSVGQVFLRFQWDILLLEAGFLALFVIPRGPRPGLSAIPVGRWVLWLHWLLLFKLMFSSGYGKLASGDPTWRDLSALTFHYETQPLPTWIGWYAHQLPAAFHQLCALMMFVIQIGAPLAIPWHWRARQIAAVVLLALQLLIAATGNYCFFNLLSLGLIVWLFDDRVFRRISERLPEPEAASVRPFLPVGLDRIVTVVVLGFLTYANAVALTERVAGYGSLPQPIVAVADVLSPLMIVNQYGLFTSMTTKRLEIVIEGSRDGRSWQAYDFHDKPGQLDRGPRFVAPHQPRLDWQMWFAALTPPRRNRWLGALMIRLMQGSEPVAGLLLTDPFADGPPRFMRARISRYRFTTAEQKAKTGAWWKREEIGDYIPAFSLEDAR